MGFPGGSEVKICLPIQETCVWSLSWEDSPGEGNGNPLQYSCLEDSMDRGAWWATVHGATQRIILDSQVSCEDLHTVPIGSHPVSPQTSDISMVHWSQFMNLYWDIVINQSPYHVQISSVFTIWPFSFPGCCCNYIVVETSSEWFQESI